MAGIFGRISASSKQSFGEKIARFYGADQMKVLNFGLAKKFYDRYDYNALAKENHLTAEQIAEDILANL